jgi:hypothetical protein
MLPTHSALNTQTLASCVQVKPFQNVNESIKLKCGILNGRSQMLYLLRETNSRYSNQLPKEKHIDNMTGKNVLAF